MTERKTVALNMIVKDCEDHLDITLDSAEHVGFDEVVIIDTGSTDSTPDKARRRSNIFRSYTNYDPVVIDGKPYLSDFAGARNYARAITKSDYIFYLDSDDVLWNPFGLRNFIDEFIRTGEADGFHMDYDYGHDEHGNCVIRHATVRCGERISHLWKSPIHEVLCSVFLPRKTKVPPDVSRAIHDTTLGDEKNRCARNAAVAKFWIDKLGEKNVEPRLWLNYGKSLVTLERHEEAMDALGKYLDGSSWNEERYFAFLFRGDSCMYQKLYEDAYAEYLKAVRLFPEFADAYLKLARCAVLNDEPKKAIFYATLVKTLDFSNYHASPFIQKVGASQVLVHAYFDTLQLRECIEECNNVLKEYPFDSDVLAKKVVASKTLRKEELLDAYRKVEWMISLEGSEEKSKAIGKAVPRAIEYEPEIFPLIEIPDDKPRVAFFCGQTAETWGYDSHLRGGIGGSETAVIYMSEELSKLGWRVEVYGFPSDGQEGEHNGVVWAPYQRYFNVKPPEVAVIWRTPSWMTWVENVPVKYIWNHDVQIQNKWRREYWEQCNGILFLSKAHRRTAPWIPEDKAWYSANGLDPSFHEDGPNEADRLIYASGPDRGLDTLLELWPQIRERHPSAQLDIFYGFTPLFKETMKTSERYRNIYDSVVKGIQQEGVNWHGRVDQRELARQFARAGVWAYPTSFPEISCITAMQAQANGAVPVTTGYAALAETVRHGKVVGGVGEILYDSPDLRKRWLEVALKTICNERVQKAIRKDMIPWARKNFLWSSIARQWSTRFKKDLESCSIRTPQVTLK